MRPAAFGLTTAEREEDEGLSSRVVIAICAPSVVHRMQPARAQASRGRPRQAVCLGQRIWYHSALGFERPMIFGMGGLAMSAGCANDEAKRNLIGGH